MKKHDWYLDSTIVPLALLDDDVPDEEKEEIAMAILQHSDKFQSVDQFKYETKKNVDFEELNFDQSTRPSLAKLVDDHSTFLFLSLGIKLQNLKDCFALPARYWDTQSCFKKFREFATNLAVVNDDAERAVGKN